MSNAAIGWLVVLLLVGALIVAGLVAGWLQRRGIWKRDKPNGLWRGDNLGRGGSGCGGGGCGGGCGGGGGG